MSLRLIYPSRRRIDEREVIAWARDLMTDDAIDALTEAERADDATVDRTAQSVPIPTLDEAKTLLEDRGKATFGA